MWWPLNRLVDPGEVLPVLGICEMQMLRHENQQQAGLFFVLEWKLERTTISLISLVHMSLRRVY